MKIIVTVRTLNEEHNIGRFCAAYQTIADQIFVADGGSEDRTVEVAKSYPKVQVRRFAERVEGESGYWRNPECEHVNFLIDWAVEAGADWIIHDDCDCVPNFMLREEAREILADTTEPMLMLYRFYFWRFDKYFPDLSLAGNARWAWMPSAKVRCTAKDPWAMEMKAEAEKKRVLKTKYCLLHYFCQTAIETEYKLKFYRESGAQPNALHPLEFGGDLALPDWFMSEEKPEWMME